MSLQHRACRYNECQPWEATDLPPLFVEMLPNNDKGSHEFAEFIELWQGEHGLKADGMLGPRTLAAINKMYDGEYVDVPRVMEIGGGMRTVPFCVVHGQPFSSKDRGQLPDRIDIHESVTNDPDIFEDDDTTERILRRKCYGVHIMIGPDGSVVQHNDLAEDMVAHVGKFNRRSIGIEVVGPYYKPHPPWWSQVISAPWAHMGKYALPPSTQLEVLWLVIKAIARHSEYEGAPLAVPLTHAGAYPDPDYSGVTRICMGRLPSSIKARRTGIFAHGYTGHADGYFPALYVYLRMAGLTQVSAYSDAIELATGARKYVEVQTR